MQTKSQSKSIEGRVAMVTGAARRIGAASLADLGGRHANAR